MLIWPGVTQVPYPAPAKPASAVGAGLPSIALEPSSSTLPPGGLPAPQINLPAWVLYELVS